MADLEVIEERALVELMCSAARLVACGEAVGLAAVAELARRREAAALADPLAAPVDAEERGRFVAAEVAVALKLSQGAARARLELARDLATRLVGTRAALSEGRISPVHARRIHEALADLDDEQAALVEAAVLKRAQRQTPAQLGASLRRAVLRVRGGPEPERATRERAAARRGVRVYPTEDGLAVLSITARADLVMAAYERIIALAAQRRDTHQARRAHRATTSSSTARTSRASSTTPNGPTTPNSAATPNSTATANGPATANGAGTTPAFWPDHHAPATWPDPPPGPSDLEPLGLEQARADVALDLLAGDAETLAAVDNVHITLGLVAPAGTILGADEEPADLVGYGPIPAQVARELAADATWQRWWTTPAPTHDNQTAPDNADGPSPGSSHASHAAPGTVTGVGRRRYRPNPALADAIRARDGHCRFPTCRRRASACDLDHVTPYATGGATTNDNLITLCRHHHRLKHRADWRLTLHPNGSATWTTPTGHRHTTEPRRWPTPTTSTPLRHTP